MSHTLSSIRTLPRAAKLYLIYSGISSLYFAWPIFIAYLSGRFGLANVGLYFSVYSLTGLFAEVPTGYIADKFGKRFSVISGICLKIVAIFILVTMSSRLSLILNAFLYGLGVALISGAIDALLYDNVTHEEYEKTLSSEIVFYQGGLVLSAIAGGYMFQINQHLPVVAEMILLGVLIIPVWYMAQAEDDDDHIEVLHVKEAMRSVKRIVSHKLSLMFLFVYLVSVLVHELYIDLSLEKKMIELNIAPSGRGLIIALIKLVALFLLQRLLFKRLNSVRLKALVAIGTGIVIFPLIGLVHAVSLFVPLYFLSNAQTMLRDTYLSPIMQRLSTKRTRATDISTYSLAARIPIAIAAPLASIYLSDHSTMLIYFAFGISLAVILPIVLQLLKWYEQKPQLEN